MMLLFIAQPTRKHPESLPQYQPLYSDTGDRKPPKREKTGEEILLELIG